MSRAVLVRYRVLAYVTAVLLLVLVFVTVPLQAAGHPGPAKVVGILHGTLYIVYLFVAFELTRVLHVPLGRTLLVLLAGTIPFGAIVAERKLTALYRQAVASAGVDGTTAGVDGTSAMGGAGSPAAVPGEA